jgi:hypothetical protein
MGLGDLWNRLVRGNKTKRVEEELRDEGAEQPPPVEDFEGMKDDVAIDERFRGEERGLDRDE